MYYEKRTKVEVTPVLLSRLSEISAEKFGKKFNVVEYRLMRDCLLVLLKGYFRESDLVHYDGRVISEAEAEDLLSQGATSEYPSVDETLTSIY